MVNESNRESIWSVPQGTIHVFLVLFVLQFLSGTFFVSLRLVQKSTVWPDGAIHLWQYVAPLAIASAASAIVLTEMGLFVYKFLEFLWSRVVVLASAFSEYLRRRSERAARTPKAVAPKKVDFNSRDTPPRAFGGGPPSPSRPVVRDSEPRQPIKE